MWGESKLAKMVCSGSLTPRFVNNDYVKAEITHSTAPVCHEVLACSRATLCCRDIKSGGITAASWLCPLGQPREERTQLYCYGCCVSQERSCVTLCCVMFYLLLQPLC